jgi:heptosyltransferase-2/heptosyltransferase-3
VVAGQPIVCVQPGSKRTMRRGRVDRSSNTKFWPVSNWSEVIDQVIATMPRAQVLLCGVPNEVEMCEAVRDSCRDAQSVKVVADDLPIRRLLALMSMAHSCISVDTGPAHVAAAVNCPVVVLFGQADPRMFRPVSDNSPVRVIVGHDENDPASSPSIGNITAIRVIDEWNTMLHSRQEESDG